ncbi:MAG: energy transducer TonB [Bacteroidota bacterium]|nr:energy transducer TonB [Bacteroidota bacterium]
MPEFPGGVDSLMQFISATLQYPNTEADVTGMIITMFTVEKSGKISDIKLLRGIEKDYDNEALRIIKLMPDWIPGKKNGKPVNVKTIVPIRFLLK